MDDELIRRPERKEKLKSLLSEVIDSDALMDEDVVAIIEICQKACDRVSVELMEEYLSESIGGGE